ncbi:hypothetical protein HO133_008503 [Letharia lupina]|uniref:Uncharacterized protein n=1 Tax=Letharia lupina TaxID=560253 RepID=A0A8H6FFX6_9LECA|nr:uncharacterized protein HO133_008503 [Letharia lupina]KAF6227062.1 hypothetical protein HO133_008503 [Letharia lupina]
MSSSSNRYAVLGEASSSSKEQQQDTAQPGPPAQREGLSMGSLESSLPRVLSREEGLAEYKKRRLAWKEEQAQEDERKKRRQVTSSTLVPRLIPSAAPESDDGMEVEKEFNCQNIINLDRRIRCVFGYEDAKGDFTDPLDSL